MFKTRLCDLLDIEYPIIGGCMMHISGPEFVAAISNAGALGMMSSVMFPSEGDFRQAIRRVRERTDRPFGVNLSLLPARNLIDNDMYVRVILEEGYVPIVETSGFRPPQDIVSKLKAAGIKTMHKCVSMRHAKTAQDIGVDAVTVFGTEGGGHIGELGLTTMVLVPTTVDALEIPVIAAGGIADGRGFLAALSLGASGITMGTRLLLTDECPIHHELKRALLAARETDTIPVLGTLHNAIRAWRNAAAERTAELEAKRAPLGEILSVVAGDAAKRMFDEGDVNSGIIACSEGIGIVDEVKPVAEVIKGIIADAEDILKRMSTARNSIEESPA